MKSSFLNLLLFFVGLLTVSDGATKYLRQGASGSGSGDDWTNAYTTSAALETGLARGDTGYVADGTYSGFTFNTAQSGTSVITIKKASVADHGTSTGWSDTYGDGQAVFGPINIQRGYFTMDGQYRNDSDWFSKTAYGFSVADSGSATTQFSIANGATPVPNVKLKYIAILNVIAATTVDSIGIDTRNGTSAPQVFSAGCEFSYIYQEGGWQHFWMVGMDQPLIEKCATYAIASSPSGDPFHSESVNLFYCTLGGGIIRHNIFRDHCNGAEGTSAGGSTAVIAMAYTGSTSGTTEIYGNVFDGWNAYAVLAGTGFEDNKNISVYNNTFINRAGDDSYGQVVFPGSGDGGVNNVAYNNLTTSSVVTFGGVGTFTNNTTVTSTAYVDYTARNYRLAAATAAGTTLASPYNVDLLGNTRGADGTWDRGAYEYVTGGGGSTITVGTLNIGN